MTESNSTGEQRIRKSGLLETMIHTWEARRLTSKVRIEVSAANSELETAAATLARVGTRPRTRHNKLKSEELTAQARKANFEGQLVEAQQRASAAAAEAKAAVATTSEKSLLVKADERCSMTML